MLVLFCRPLFAAPESFEVYPVPFADLEPAERVIKAMVGPERMVIADERHRRIMVTATAEQHARIQEFLEKYNLPPRNIDVLVRFDEKSDEANLAAGVEGGGQMVIHNGDVDVTGVIKPRLENRSSQSDAQTTQHILVANGRSASLRVGEEVPYLNWIMQRGWRWGVIESELNWQRVGAQLDVEVVILGSGPMMKLRLVPVLSGLVEGKPHQLRFKEVATEVVVQSGQTVSLAGMDKDNDFYDHFLLGMSKGHSRSALNITLTPTIREPVTPPGGYHE